MNQKDQILFELKEMLVERGILQDVQVSSQAPLSDLKIDSVEMALIFAFFEEKYDAEFENQEIVGGQNRCLDDIAATITKKVRPAVVNG